MTDKQGAAADEVEDAPNETPAKSPRFGKRTLIIAGAAVLLLAGGTGAAIVFLGGSETKPTAHEAVDEPAAEAGAEVLVDVPPLILNLRSADGVARFLKLHFMLVAASPEAAEAIKGQLPLLIDAYQPFLRELRPEDLAGSAAVFRIKEELLVRATATLGAGKVKDVLVQDLIQQ